MIEVKEFIRTIENMNAKLDRINKFLMKESKQEKVPHSEYLSLEKAVDYLNGMGIEISKSKFYKLTAQKELVFKRFSNRIIFDKNELILWIEKQLINPLNQ